MVWDYAEANPFSNSSGNFLGAGLIVDVLRMLSPKVNGRAGQYDSTMLIPIISHHSSQQILPTTTISAMQTLRLLLRLAKEIPGSSPSDIFSTRWCQRKENWSP